MSRFGVNKFIAWVEGADAEATAYAADPAAYVAAWEARAAGSRLPTPDSGTLTDEERSALVAVDHGELYRLGAHPYMLWHFVEAVRVWAGDATWPEMKERFREDVIPHGYPDITT